VTRDVDDTWSTDDEAVTAEEQLRGRSLDARLGEETRRGDNEGEAQPAELVDHDTPDTEAELVSDLAAPADRAVAESDEDTAGFGADTGWSPEIEEDTLAAEELAMSVRDGAPGGTSDESDGYVEDDEDTP
jgi:hypothetical protein